MALGMSSLRNTSHTARVIIALLPYFHIASVAFSNVSPSLPRFWPAVSRGRWLIPLGQSCGRPVLGWQGAFCSASAPARAMAAGVLTLLSGCESLRRTPRPAVMDKLQPLDNGRSRTLCSRSRYPLCFLAGPFGPSASEPLSPMESLRCLCGLCPLWCNKGCVRTWDIGRGTYFWFIGLSIRFRFDIYTRGKLCFWTHLLKQTSPNSKRHWNVQCLKLRHFWFFFFLIRCLWWIREQKQIAQNDLWTFSVTVLLKLPFNPIK